MPTNTVPSDRTTDPDLLTDLVARGLIQDSTDRAELAERLSEGPITVYVGFDPTADSLHAGNLVGLLMLRRFQDAGHRVISLAGGATGMVGDPSGKSDERNLLDDDALANNLAGIVPQCGSSSISTPPTTRPSCSTTGRGRWASRSSPSCATSANTSP
ncbi:MAG: hypothetical protein R2710_07080 [Acidimicrobiales bacterium]